MAARAAQPTRIRFCTGHQEHVPDIGAGDGPGAIAPRDRLQAPVSLESYDLRSRSHLDRGGLFDPAKKISRHALRKTVRSNEHMNTPASPRQKHRRLTSGVGTADDDRLIIVAELRVLHEGRVVVDADTFEPTEILDRRLAIWGSRGNDHGAGWNRGAVLEPQGVDVSFAGQLGGALRDHDFGAKLLRLGIRTFGQLLTRNPCRKAQVVFDARARSRLSARRTGLDHQRIECLRRRVDCARKTSRPRAADDDITLSRMGDPALPAG